MGDRAGKIEGGRGGMNITKKDLTEISKQTDLTESQIADDIMRLAQLGNTKEEIEKMVDVMKARKRECQNKPSS